MANDAFFLAPLCTDYGSNLRDVASGRVMQASAAITYQSTGGKNYAGYTRFDGSGPLTLGISPRDFNHATEPFTVEAWVMATVDYDSASRYVFRLTSDPTPAYASGVIIGLNPNTGFYFGGGSGASDFTISQNSAPPSINTWVHVAGCYNPTTKKLDLYVNGVLVATNSGNTFGDVANLTKIYIGYDPGNSARGWKGGIQDVCVSKGIKYTATFLPPERLAVVAAGNVTREDAGTPLPSVYVRNQRTLRSYKTDAIADGSWGMLVPKGDYDIAYMAQPLKPEIHGNYSL